MGRFSLNLSASNAGGSDAPSLDEARYIAPDQTGTAPNGKTYLTLEQAIANLTRTGGNFLPTGNGVITYSFLDQAPGGLYLNPHETYLGGLVSNFSPFTTEQRDATREVIGLWDDLIAITFREVEGKGADILFMNTGEGGPGQAGAFIPQYQGKYGKIEGDVFVNAFQHDNFDLDYGGYGQHTLVHEFGHAIGLSHTGDYNATGPNGEPQSPTYSDDAAFFQDTRQYSVMSYFHAGNSGAFGYVNWATGGFGQTPQTPMIHDIAAAQALYGVDLTTRTGDTRYGFGSTADRDVFDFEINKNPFLTIYDAGGHDTLDFSGFTGGRIILDLRPGALSTGYSYGEDAVLDAALGINLTQAQWNLLYDGLLGANPGFLSENIGIAYNTIIEDGVTGAGNDILMGNNVANRLSAGAGNDLLSGLLGNDILDGGTGVDIVSYEGATAGVTVSLAAAGPHVTVEGSDTFVGIEGLHGSNFVDNLTGDAGANILNGLKGNDSLTGGAGADEFQFTEIGYYDTITDFVSGSDKIRLSVIDANANTAGNQAFTFIGAAAFSGAAGQLRTYSQDGSNYVAGDVNGDGVADFTINLGAATAVGTDFFL